MDFKLNTGSCCMGKKGCSKIQNNKLNTYDWLCDVPDAANATDYVEVQFKNTRKGYYLNSSKIPLEKGDLVAVEASPGHDIGTVTLTGKLVLLQMKKNNVRTSEGNEPKKVYRKAKPTDIEKYEEAKAKEHATMIRSRQIAADLGLNMKIGDVEYQGDGNKAIFYYIADERVDFRQLIKVLAEAFRVRIEMKQIGARQEAGRIGGIGPCGRELCCCSYLEDFHPVSINMAKDQNLSLNPAKISGVCGRLMCCLKYEHEAYAELQKVTPKQGSVVDTPEGRGKVITTQMLRGTCKVQLDDSPEHSLTEFQCTDCCVVKGACRNRQNAAAMAEERRRMEQEAAKQQKQQNAVEDLPDEAQGEQADEGAAPAEGAPRRRRRRGGRRRHKPQNAENAGNAENAPVQEHAPGAQE